MTNADVCTLVKECYRAALENKDNPIICDRICYIACHVWENKFELEFKLSPLEVTILKRYVFKGGQNA